MCIIENSDRTKETLSQCLNVTTKKKKKITILQRLDYYLILARSIANDCGSYQNSCLLYKSSKTIFISFSKE